MCHIAIQCEIDGPWKQAGNTVYLLQLASLSVRKANRYIKNHCHSSSAAGSLGMAEPCTTGRSQYIPVELSSKCFLFGGLRTM